MKHCVSSKSRRVPAVIGRRKAFPLCDAVLGGDVHSRRLIDGTDFAIDGK